MGIATWTGAISEPYWRERIFEPFALRLHQLRMGMELPGDVVSRDIRAYGSVLENWENPDRLAEALIRICDYHCDNMEDSGGEWDPEFRYPPFDLMPAEVLAVYAIREQLGVETPKVEHPLLSLPLSSVVRVGTAASDGLLERVDAAYAECFQ